MKKKKLTLEELKVESFVTTLGLQHAHQVFGGVGSAWQPSDSGCGSFGGCSGSGITGNGNGGGNTINVGGGPCDPSQTTVRCNTTSDCGNAGGGDTGGGTTGGGTTPPVVITNPAPPVDSIMCYTQNACYG